MNLHGRLAQALVACGLMLVACRLWLVAHRFLSVVYCPCDNLSQVCKIWGASKQMSLMFAVGYVFNFRIPASSAISAFVVLIRSWTSSRCCAHR
jgi:hypothetical protein